MWLIPGQTKVKLEIFKGVGLAEVAIGAVSASLVVALVASNFEHKFVWLVAIVCLTALLVVKVDDEPNYMFLFKILKHFAYHRNYVKGVDDDMLLAIEDKGEREAAWDSFVDAEEQKQEETESAEALKDKVANAKKDNTNWEPIEDITAFTGIHDGYIEYNGQYYGAAIEISPVEFRFYSEDRRKASITNGLGRILKSVNTSYSTNIIKVDRPVHYEEYLKSERDKLDELRRSYEHGMMREEEFKARVDIICDRMNELESMINEDRVVVPFYYLVLFDADKNLLDHHVNGAIEDLEHAELPVKLLDSKELAIFLKYTNAVDVDETEIDKLDEDKYAAWATPNEVTFTSKFAYINNIISYTMRITSFSPMVGDAWLASVMSIPGTKVVIKSKPMDMDKSIRGIDRSLAELRYRLNSTGVDSKAIELQTHIESLEELLGMLSGENETLLETNVYVTAYDIALTNGYRDPEHPIESKLPNITNMRKTVRRLYREKGMRMNNLNFEQLHGYIATQVSGYDPFSKKGRGIPSNSISAAYPWIYATVSDVGGIKIGEQDGVPVFVDFFRRDSERVNSNMVVIGKSGSGKSYSAKFILTNLAAEDSKIFILDPENEYASLAENLHGKFINVGNAQQGRMNPFHIMTAAEDEDDNEEGTVSGSYATHLQFLEEFFKQILPDCDKDALEYLNTIVDRMYTERGINAETDFRKLKPEDYPVFDDLYDAILQEFQKTDNEYIRRMLRVLMNYVAKFSAGGRNANIWNGPSTITTDENFTVFNFQSLLSNRNSTIANAQMLLVLKYIDNEIIKNRDYNTKNGMHRKVIVVIDEAHVFIDEKFPIALDFMFQLAKRIRKYNGMQMVLTQNIKDFVGTEELARKSTAIINACQYSCIFPLAPNDMTDLCKLYDKAGGINESEQEGILQASRGQAFTIMSPTSRSSFKVDVPDNIRDIFEYPGYESEYFGTDPNDEVWVDFLGESRQKHDMALSDRITTDEYVEEDASFNNFVGFEEISEDELSEFENNNTESYSTPGFRFEEIPESEYTESLPEAYADEGADEMDTSATLSEYNGSKSDTFTNPSVAPNMYSNPETVAYAGVDPAANAMYSASVDACIAKLTDLNTRMLEEMNARIDENSRTQNLITELLANLTKVHENENIQNTIELEVAKKVAEALAGLNIASLAGAANAPAANSTDNTSFADSYEDSSSMDEYDDTFDEGEEETSETSESDEEETESSGVSFSIFDSLNDEDTEESDISDEDDEDDDDDDDGFDIMAMLAAEAERMAEVSNIEQMELYGEEVIDITLEDLTKYINNLLKNAEN